MSGYLCCKNKISLLYRRTNSISQSFKFVSRKKGILSISVCEKNWRYHRELRDVEHPTSIMIAEYEPNLKII